MKKKKKPPSITTMLDHDDLPSYIFCTFAFTADIMLKL